MLVGASTIRSPKPYMLNREDAWFLLGGNSAGHPIGGSSTKYRITSLFGESAKHSS